MKIVFFGTPSYCTPILDLLKKEFTKKSGDTPILAVVTQTPRPKDRTKYLAFSAVDDWAHKRKIPKFYSCEELNQSKIKADLGIVVAYGEIIPQETIDSFPFGILNIHPSLLPKYRGASPLQAAIAMGEKESGATIIKIDNKMDHGPIVSQFTEEIKDDDTSLTLGSRIFNRSAQVLVELIPPYLAGKIKPKIQDEDKVSYTTLLKKDHGFIPGKYLEESLKGKELKKENWNIQFVKEAKITPNADNIEKLMRSLSPWPGIWTIVKTDKGSEEKRLKILKCHKEEKRLIIDIVQLEGKDPVSWEQFQTGYPNFSFF